MSVALKEWRKTVPSDFLADFSMLIIGDYKFVVFYFFYQLSQARKEKNMKLRMKDIVGICLIVVGTGVILSAKLY